MTHGEDFTIQLTLPHRVRFTRDAFAAGNACVWNLLETNGHAKILVFVERAVAEAFPRLAEQITEAVAEADGYELKAVLVMEGAELAKRDDRVLQSSLDAIEKNAIDRHSYVFCIGGGAFLDVIGFAAATAHRGVRFVRFPTTTLAQDDSGVGVKNGINAYGKKNFLGTFSVPFGVINDFAFLDTQDELTRRAGLIEAVKVALVRDGEFFDWLEAHAQNLRAFERSAVEEAVRRSALLHARHIALGGDPFETGSSRPLDYGHWAAHKLEQLTDFSLSHAEAVAVGVALDSLYAALIGTFPQESADRVLALIEALDLPLYHAALELRSEEGIRRVYEGLEEFREHLGGELTVLLLDKAGHGIDVHSLDTAVLDQAIELLKIRSS